MDPRKMANSPMFLSMSCLLTPASEKLVILLTTTVAVKSKHLMSTHWMLKANMPCTLFLPFLKTAFRCTNSFRTYMASRWLAVTNSIQSQLRLKTTLSLLRTDHRKPCHLLSTQQNPRLAQTLASIRMPRRDKTRQKWHRAILWRTRLSLKA